MLDAALAQLISSDRFVSELGVVNNCRPLLLSAATATGQLGA